MSAVDEEWPDDDRRWRFVWRDDDIVWLTGPLAEGDHADAGGPGASSKCVATPEKGGDLQGESAGHRMMYPLLDGGEDGDEPDDEE